MINNPDHFDSRTKVLDSTYETGINYGAICNSRSSKIATILSHTEKMHGGHGAAILKIRYEAAFTQMPNKRRYQNNACSGIASHACVNCNLKFADQAALKRHQRLLEENAAGSGQDVDTHNDNLLLDVTLSSASPPQKVLPTQAASGDSSQP